VETKSEKDENDDDVMRRMSKRCIAVSEKAEKKR
jgi:hypothetical protein